MDSSRVAFVASEHDDAQAALARLVKRYKGVPADEAEVIVALGGDGFMLETMHRFMNRKLPIYGMNRGTVGFLMNGFAEKNLIERLEEATPVRLYPLRMRATTIAGQVVEALAFNEVSLLRESRQAAKLKISVDDKVRLEEMVCDGVMVCSPAGSTAYNASAHGPILPIGSNVLAVTPISAFRPRRWRGAILPHTANVQIEVKERFKRPVSAVADFTEVRDVAEVEVKERRRTGLTLLFDPEHNLEERILQEQFMH